MKKIILIAITILSMLIIAACAVREEAVDLKLPEAVALQSESTVKTTHKESTSLPQFTARDVAAHNFKTDCWVVNDGYVYDVTQWFMRNTEPVDTSDSDYDFRVGSDAQVKSQYDDAQYVLLRHCGTVSAFEDEFFRTELSLKKSRAFIELIGVLS